MTTRKTARSCFRKSQKGQHETVNLNRLNPEVAKRVLRTCADNFCLPERITEKFQHETFPDGVHTAVRG